MKGKLLLISAAIATLVSVNTSAMEIYKGKLLSHKESSASHDKFSFKQNLKSPLLAFQGFKQKNHSKQNSGTMIIYTVADGGAANIGETTPFSGTSNIMVENTTDSVQEYGYQQTVCVDISEHETHCADMMDRFELESGGYFQSSDLPTVEVTFAEGGNYNETLFAEVSSNNGDRTNSMAIGSVSVSSNGKK